MKQPEIAKFAPAATGRERGRPLSKWLVRGGLLILALLLSLLVLTTDSQPITDARPAPTADQVAAARDAVRQLRENSDAPMGARPMNLTPAHLDGLSALASHAFRPDRLDVFVFESELHILASHKLPLGRWLNVTATAQGDAIGFPATRLRIGSISLSPYLSRALIDVVHSSAWAVGVALPSLDELVSTFSIEGEAVIIAVNLPRESGVIDRLLGVQSGLSASLVSEAYCRLAKQQSADPQSDLAVHVRRAFPIERAAEATPDKNGAAFVALAMLIVDKKVGALAGIDLSTVERCPAPAITILLHGRGDLPKHWALSAALATGPGKQIAEAMGEWKELADSLSKDSEFRQGDPTGFSFIDISADRAGLRTAEAALMEQRATLMAARLSRATQSDILPSALLAKEEGADFDFASQYGGLDDQRYAAAIQTIDAALDRKGLLKGLAQGVKRRGFPGGSYR